MWLDVDPSVSLELSCGQAEPFQTDMDNIIAIKRCSCSEKTLFSDCKEDAALVDALEQPDIHKLCTLIRERGRLDMNRILAFRKMWGCMLMTAFQYAAKKGLVQILKVLLSTGSVPERVTCCEPRTPLHLACRYRIADVSLDMAVDITQHGACINQGSRWGTALKSAVVSQYSQLVRYLCEHGANANFASHFGDMMPIICAAKGGNAEIIHTLCEHGADVNYTDGKWGKSATFHAATYGNVEAIGALCQHGADINKREGPDRNTPLMMACCFSYADTVAELLRNEADVSLRNDKGNSALHMVSSSLYIECRDETIEIVKMLLKHPKCHYDNKNAHGETALELILGEMDLYSYIEPLLNIIELLIKAGCLVPNMPHGKCPFGLFHTFLLSMEMEACNKLYVSKTKVLHPNIVRLCNCLDLLLSAGSKLGELEWLSKRFRTPHAILEQRGILDYAQRCTGVASLKRLSKFATRKHVKKPLPDHVLKTGLPCDLQGYVLLEQVD